MTSFGAAVADKPGSPEQTMAAIQKPKLVSENRLATEGPLDGQATRAGQKPDDTPTVRRIQRLENLLSFESQVRNVKSLRELWYCISNEALNLTAGKQIFVLTSSQTRRNRVRIRTISNISSIDPDAPAIVTLEDQFTRAYTAALSREPEKRRTPHGFNSQLMDSKKDCLVSRSNSMIVPIFDASDRSVGALVLRCDGVDFAAELPVIQRLAEVSQYAWQAVAPRRRLAFLTRRTKPLSVVGILLLAMALFIKVPLSTLAPVEIVASDPQIISAPIGGIIREVLVDGNTEVETGTPLFQYEDTVLQAELKIAQQAWSVAHAKLKRAQQSSFGQGGGQRDLTTARAELELAKTELDFARAKHSKTTVTAPKGGVVILGRKSDWQGKPVSVGQRVMEIAQISRVEARIDLPVSDAIVLNQNADVQLYLDTDPLNAKDAKVTSASYRAALDASNELSFMVTAQLAQSSERTPRIGARGTAQIYGEKVSVAFYLFRRPLAAIRQWIGW